MNRSRGSDLRCPDCGVGVLGNIAYHQDPGVPSGIKQAPESREVLTFSCGHEVEARRLDETAGRDPNVERRTSDETVAGGHGRWSAVMTANRSERPDPSPDPTPEHPDPPGPLPDPLPPPEPTPEPQPAPAPPPDGDPPIRVSA
jgi:hypothetical protein